MICPHCDIYWGDEPHTKAKYCQDCNKLIDRTIGRVARQMVRLENERILQKIDDAIAKENIRGIEAALRSLLKGGGE